MKDNVMKLENFFKDREDKAQKAAALNMAWMNTRLCVPLIIRDIMDRPESLDDETVFGLHDLISDFEIDTGLLAIATGALQIVRAGKINTPAMHVLAIECERIICEYGDEWIKQHDTTNGPDEDYILSILPNIAEDFESLCDLIESALSVMNDENVSATLLDILSIQANAHSMIAAEFINVMEAEIQIEAPIIVADKAASNVVAFRTR